MGLQLALLREQIAQDDYSIFPASKILVENLRHFVNFFQCTSNYVLYANDTKTKEKLLLDDTHKSRRVHNVNVGENCEMFPFLTEAEGFY